MIVTGGYETTFAAAWDIAAERYIQLADINLRGNVPGHDILEANERYVCIRSDGQPLLFDAATFRRLDDPALLRQLPDRFYAPDGRKEVKVSQLLDGRWVGVRGQEYFVTDRDRTKCELRPIPGPGSVTDIHTLTADRHGVVWGACALGQTIFRYDPLNGACWNSPAVCDANGEVYGMNVVGDALFLTCYAGGDHVLYDPDQPWDQVRNLNPRTLHSFAPALIRPEARGVIGPDGAIWTGWSVNYGLFGGGLSRLDPVTLKIAQWESPVPDQKIVGITADERYVYFITMSGGNGVVEREGEPYHFFVWNAAAETVCKASLPKPFAAGVGAMLAIGSFVLVRENDAVRIFDPGPMQFVRTAAIGMACDLLLAHPVGQALAFCRHRLYAIDPFSGAHRFIADLPVGDRGVETATLTPSGDLYFGHYSHLCVIRADSLVRMLNETNGIA